MKHVVVSDGLTELTVRPRALFDEYIHLLEADIRTFFKDRSDFKDVPCPGCLSSDRKPAFEKLTFDYRECAVCGSLYASPRPSSEKLNGFYKESGALKFWRSN